MTVSLHCDLQTTIGVSNNNVYNKKKRHTRIRHSVVKQMLKHDVIALEYMKSERNLADPLAEGLTKQIVLEMSRGMELKPMD